jgi:uncharacterized protein YjbI with pentapeptide repeats
MSATATTHLRDTCQSIVAANADLSGSTFDDVGLRAAQFRNVDLSDAVIENANLTGLRFAKVNLSGLTFDDVGLRAAQFRNVDLSDAIIENVNLAGLRVDNVNLSGASFADCTLTGMTIDGVLVTELFAAYRAVCAGG